MVPPGISLITVIVGIKIYLNDHYIKWKVIDSHFSFDKMKLLSCKVFKHNNFLRYEFSSKAPW